MTEKLIQCPYIPSHQLRGGTRLQTHLMKCRTNTLKDTLSPFHKNATEIEICQFDKTHHIHKSKMMTHIQESCPAALSVAKLRYVDKSEDIEPYWTKATAGWNDAASLPQSKPAPVVKPVPAILHNCDDEEDWESELIFPVTYDPMKKIENSNQVVLNQPYGMTPSERRLFRQEKRIKANEVTKTDENFEPVQKNNSVRPKEPENKAMEFKPLRRPNNAPPPGANSVTLSHGRGKGSMGLNSIEEHEAVNLDMEKMNIGRGRGRGGGLRRPTNAPPGFESGKV